VRQVRVIDPNNLALVRETLDWALSLDEPAVIITRWPCVLKRITEAEKSEFNQPFTGKYRVNEDKCIGCKICLRSGCPAISVDAARKKSGIDPAQCVGCSVCAQLCPKSAIEKEEN
jgi:indolepyruvate ferredoxin oxidoreductase alpha subunit